jgi:hypothetical protein
LFAFFLMKTSRQQTSYIESACMHGKVIEALPNKSAAELREFFKGYLSNWKDDMVVLLFADEG